MRGITPAGADRWRAAAGWWLPVWPLASPRPGRHPNLLSCARSLHTSGAFHTWICLHLSGSRLGSGVSLHLLAHCEQHLFCCLRWLIIKLEHKLEKKKGSRVFLQWSGIMILLHMCFCSFHHLEYKWEIAHALICWERTSTRKEHELVRNKLVNKEPLR